MHLLTALAAGIKGAENGTAELYSRGTSTRATFYNDFEGTSSDSTGADVDLDSNGGAVVYVNEYVTVIAKSSSGGTIRTFTDGASGNAVEIISDSFTGTDYIDGSSAVSEPIALTPVMDKWNDSAGAADWKVDVGGTATNLSTAIASASGPFFDVTNPTYGATGDGTTDDTAAIALAEAAADDAGGILYFPQGTYRITSTITTSGAVSFQGAGQSASVIKLDSAANDDAILFGLGGVAANKHVFISDIKFTCNQANTGSFITFSSSTPHITRCWFLGTNLTGPIIDGGGRTISDCFFAPDASGDSCIKASSSQIYGCTFDVPSAYADNVIDIRSGAIVGNRFDVTSMIAGAAVGIFVSNSGNGDRLSIIGNEFSKDGGASTFTPIHISDLTGGALNDDTGVIEFGNGISNTYEPYTDGLAPGDITAHDTTNVLNVMYGSRVGKIRHYPNISGNTTIHPLYAEIITIDITGAGAYTINCDTLPPPGSRFVLILYCSNAAGSGPHPLGTGFADSGDKTLGADHDVNIYEFMCAPCELTNDNIQLRFIELSAVEALQIAP